MSILSIQSHVVYGYVGNKAAVYPLQSMGFDVWPVNTVQFSCHTGYPQWRGEVFSREHIKNIINGIEAIGAVDKCQAILSGYMGSKDTCLEVTETVTRFKANNNKIIYLCDPVIGNTNCFVKPEVLEFFKTSLVADIITPNQFEAELLSGIKIIDTNSLKAVANYFHNLGIAIVVVTGIRGLSSSLDDLSIFISDNKDQYIINTKECKFSRPINGTGDLFSAIFLGTYLATNNALLAAKNAVFYMDIVVNNTLNSQSKELEVISTRYDTTPKSIQAINLLKSSLSSI